VNESSAPKLGERFANAFELAFKLHRAQTRKGSGIPYVGHLLGVASIVIDNGGSEDEAIAALLHDSAEDQGGRETLRRIRERFGETVADIVEHCSDHLDEPAPPWRERKEGYLARLEHAPAPALRVSLADKLHNVRTIVLDYRDLGEPLWDRFNAGREGVLWYYRSLAEVFARRCPGPLADELTESVADLERVVGAP
jgi:(p)ppGpp synthase/HD superfamily hydrolase